MLKKVILTSARNGYQKLLPFSIPTFEHFAKLHGYEVIIDQEELAENEDYRKARWRKIELLTKYTEEYDVVVWLDCDVMICDFERDILADMEDDSFQGLVIECLSNRFYPNTGVWVLRRDERTKRFLAEVNKLGIQKNHTLSDQPPVWLTLGWTVGDGYKGRGARLTNPSPFIAGTTWLPFAWNPLGLATKWPGRTKHFLDSSIDERVTQMSQKLHELHESGALPHQESASALPYN